MTLLTLQDTRLIATHSTLELNASTGFRLYRGETSILATGERTNKPAHTLQSVTKQGDTAYVTYETPSGSARLTITATQSGWALAWDTPTEDTFSIVSGGHWYGMGELVHQHFPLERMSLPRDVFMTWDNGYNGIGDILTPVWITSSGAAIIVDRSVDPFAMSFNAAPSAPIPERKLFNVSLEYALQRPRPAQHDADGLLVLAAQEQPLSYTIHVAQDAVSAFLSSTDQLGKPSAPPPAELLTAPIWTTWARYKADIDQARVIAFADEIRDNGFAGGTLEIDDKWQAMYGDTSFDPQRFPDPAQMVRDLNARGFHVTVWITPFLDPACANGRHAAEHGYIVQKPDGSPYLVRWWQSEGYLLDVTHPEALAWWRSCLLTLKDSAGLAGYKFDAGEANFLPADAITHVPISRNDYSRRWVEFAAADFPFGEVRCGWFNQRETILFRQWDKFSAWGLENGLASVITTALAMSMAGFSFSLPDMVGGNAYGDVVADRELLIRWTQASAPMLAMQFSLAPWDFDAEAIAICRRYAQLHVDLAPVRLAAAQGTVSSGAPVIRPIFWLDASDETALTCADQYLLGDRLLVAPVIGRGAVTRDVYLPRGRWRDFWTGTTYAAGWLRDFPAPLDTLPLFERID